MNKDGMGLPTEYVLKHEEPDISSYGWWTDGSLVIHAEGFVWEKAMYAGSRWDRLTIPFGQTTCCAVNVIHDLLMIDGVSLGLTSDQVAWRRAVAMASRDG